MHIKKAFLLNVHSSVPLYHHSVRRIRYIKYRDKVFLLNVLWSASLDHHSVRRILYIKYRNKTFLLCVFWNVILNFNSGWTIWYIREAFNKKTVKFGNCSQIARDPPTLAYLGILNCYFFIGYLGLLDHEMDFEIKRTKKF